jgi:TrmH RNA methyltransferase
MRRGPGSRPPAAGRTHAADLLRVAGLRAVEAVFDSDPGRVERLFFLPAQQAAAAPFAALLARARKPYRAVGAEELARIAGSAMHGGIVAIARPRPVLAFDPADPARWARREGLVVVLDGVSNPHNLGAIARSAAFFGVRRLILSDHPAQALPSDAAYRVAEGGLDRLDLVRARLPEALAPLGRSFLTVATALADGARPIGEIARDRPVALVLGNEERGVGAATRAACAAVARIPGGGAVQSLNVAAAAAIAIHLFAGIAR